MKTLPSFDSFFQGLGRKRQALVRDRDELERVFENSLARAREKWPGLQVDERAFVRSLALRVAEAESVVAGLAALRVSDLYAAFAAAEGDEAAVGAILSRTREDLKRALGSMRLGREELDEVLQRLRERVFVAAAGAVPRIASYSGSGSLAAWLSASATRLAIDLKRDQADRTDELDEKLASSVAQSGDHELTFLKDRYRGEFRAAFQESFAALDRAQRNLARMVFIDGLTVDELSPMLGVHRATVARRVAKVRDELAAGTRQRLREKFKLSGSELDSLIRLVTSAFDVSLSKVLAEPASHGQP